MQSARSLAQAVRQQPEEIMTYRILIVFFFPYTLFCQISFNDYFPLRVGNSWTYIHYKSSSSHLIELSYSEKGIVTYSIQSCAESSDSILWKFQQVRQLHYYLSTAPPNYSSDSGSIIDTLFFDLIEYRTGAHRILLIDDNNEYTPYIFLQSPFSDNVHAFRYYPSETPYTLIIADTLLSHDGDLAGTVTVLMQKGIGVINGSYYKAIYVGSTSGGYDTLLNAVTSVQQNNSDEFPQKFVLSQNYPNPFNPVTSIQFTLPSHSKILFQFYNILGCLVDIIDCGLLDAGYHSIIWNASHLPSGVYFCVIQNNKCKINPIKLVLLK